MSSALCGTCGNTSRNLGHSTDLPCPTQPDWVVQVLGRLIFHPKKLVLSVFVEVFPWNQPQVGPGVLGRCGTLGSLTRIAWWESFRNLGRPENLIPSNQTIPINRYQLICNRGPTLLPIMLKWKRTLFPLYGKCPRVNQGDLVGISVMTLKSLHGSCPPRAKLVHVVLI